MTMNWIKRIRERRQRRQAIVMTAGRVKEAEAIRLYINGEYEKAVRLQEETDEKNRKAVGFSPFASAK